MDDKTDRNEIVAEVIDERAAAGAIVERPAQRVLHQAAAMLVRGDLPELLEPDAEFLWLPIVPQSEMLDQGFRKAAARAFGEQRVFGAQFHAAGETGFMVAFFGDAHVAGGNPDDRGV